MSTTDKRLVDAATRLIAFEGGTINYTKLLKLLYIADRESIRTHHASITGDSYVSMNNGPVLSLAYNLIKGQSVSAAWSKCISSREGYNVSLLESPPPALSCTDKKILDQVYSQYGHMTFSQLIDVVHTYPEWKFPNGTSIPILLSQILTGCGYENGPATEISREMDDLSEVQRLLGAI